MSDEKVRELQKQAEHLCFLAKTYGGGCEVSYMANTLEADRHAVAYAARAEGEAEGYARAVERVCLFIKVWATSPGRNASIYTAHELERAIRARFGGK